MYSCFLNALVFNDFKKKLQLVIKHIPDKEKTVDKNFSEMKWLYDGWLINLRFMMREMLSINDKRDDISHCYLGEGS